MSSPEFKDCKVPECDSPSNKVGFCYKHHYRWKKYGDPNKLVREQHRMFGSPEYITWAGMKDRCYNRNCAGFKNYGLRGIEVCDRWRESFLAFYEDMGDRPTGNHSIERINNNGNYSPDNCRWDSRKRQAVNRRVFRNNTSGHRGVYKVHGKWRPAIGVNGRLLWLGNFDKLGDAIEARKNAENIYFAEIMEKGAKVAKLVVKN